MIHRRPANSRPAKGSRAGPTFHDWVLGLPWVVEGPDNLGADGVRTFAVDCEPLERRRLWLVTGMRQSGRFGRVDIALIVPLDVARFIEKAGLGEPMSPMPAGHVLLGISDCVSESPRDLQGLALTAYGYALSGE